MPFTFDHPGLLWLLLLAVPIVWLGRRSLAAMEPARRWFAVALRLAVLALLVLMLAGLQAVRRHTDLTVIAVVDQSESVRRFAQPPRSSDPGAAQPGQEPATIEQWLGGYMRDAGEDRRPGDQFGLITFDGRPSVRSAPSELVDLDPGTVTLPIDGTDTAAAIRAAIAQFPPDSGARILLVGDLNDTAGDTEAAGREAAAAGIPIDVLPIPYRVENEVIVDALYAPTDAREGQTVALRAVLRATRPGSGLLQLLHDDEPIDLNGGEPGTGVPIAQSDWTLPPEQSVGRDGADAPRPTPDAPSSTIPYIAVKQIELPLAFSGPNRFEAVFEPDTGSDAEATNNRAEAFTLVGGRGRVLFVDGIGGPSGEILPRALKSHGVELDVIEPRSFPARIGRLQRYDAVFFQNVSAENITRPQQKMLAKYVHDLGGGFAMIGGPDSFGAGGWTNTDIDRYVLPVTCQIPSQTILPSGALVLVIDRSGSMASSVAGTHQSQQEVAGEAAVLALSTLYPQDLVGVVAFDNSAKMIVNVQMNRDPVSVAKKVRSIHPGGGTNIYSGLEMGYRELAPLKAQDAAIKHMILLTDGQSQEGNYIQLVGQMTSAGISLSTIGVGDGHNAQLLQTLAMMGGGNYHPVQNPSNLPKVFIKEAKTIRKNLIKEIEFTPQLVSTGSPVMAGVSGVPALNGLVLTGPRQDPRVFMPILGPEGEPVFAHWQVGLGRSAAFTSDATNRWATRWLGWGGYADFWARLTRAIARPSASRAVDLVARIEGDQLKIRLDAAAVEQGPKRRRATGSFGNFMNVQGSVLRPDGDTEAIKLEQVGPGIYEATVPATATGNHIISLFVQEPGGRRQAVFGGASRAPGEELRRFSTNNALAARLAEITNGRLLDPLTAEPAGLFERTEPFESRSLRPLWRVLLGWLIAIFLLDVACRRIAWDLFAAWAWLRSHASAVAGALQTRPVAAEATLGALKKTRQRVAGEAADARPLSAPAPRRKFEAAPGAVAQEDFADAVGAATRQPQRPVGATGGESGEPQESESTTSRLLDARRRAQQRNESP